MPIRLAVPLLLAVAAIALVTSPGPPRPRRSAVFEWMKMIGPVLIAVFCLGTLGMGLWLLIDSVRFGCVAVRAVGKVVRIHSQWEEVNRSNDVGTWTERVIVHYPVIAFEDSAGVKQEVRANFGNICTPGFQVGESLPILFLADNPQAMRINSFMALYWNAACMLFIAAGGMMILAFWLYYV